MALKLKDIEKQKQSDDWYWESIIKQGTVNIFVGQQSKGKSMLICELIKASLKTRRGQEFLGSGVHRFKTLYVSTEMDKEELRNRFNVLGINTRIKAANENLSIYCNPMPTLLDLEREIKETNADLIVIDVFVGLITAEGRDLNSYADLNLVAAQLRKFKKTFILIHHMNKSNKAMGSTGALSAMDTRMEMLETSVDDSDGALSINQTIHIYGKSVKNRYVNVVFKYPHFTLAESDEDADELDKPIAKLMQYVIKKKDIVAGTYQEVAAECELLERYQFNPKKLGYLLKINREVLNNNNIFFETKRRNNGFHLMIWYDAESIHLDEDDIPEDAILTETEVNTDC